MNTRKYDEFLAIKGKTINVFDSSNEKVALLCNDAMECLEIFRNDQIMVYGGDVFVKDNSKYIYAYQSWGDEYQFINWYCENDGDDFVFKSYSVAKSMISDIIKFQDKFNEVAYIVFVI